jgi:DNA-binding MarR family transcriptional regulator
MSNGNASDPRVALVREKYFSLRPKPLERWLWTAKAPGSAERVFWYHWDIGHQNGTWVSQVPIRLVAEACGLDIATVTRAYQWLKGRGLIRRIDGGRDDANPFRQATAFTEVFVPRELVQRLAAEPNRRRRDMALQAQSAARQTASLPSPSEAPAEPLAPATATPVLSRRESQLVLQKLSDGERTRLYAAQRDRKTELAFDPATRLEAREQAHVLHALQLIAAARPTTSPVPARSVAPQKARAPLTMLQVAETRGRIQKSKGEGDSRDVNTLLREVVWSVEEGSLAKFDRPHAISIACKKIREGGWSTPFRMPLDWAWKRALPEMCSVAGGV